jgi:hypothetical protein
VAQASAITSSVRISCRLIVLTVSLFDIIVASWLNRMFRSLVYASLTAVAAPTLDPGVGPPPCSIMGFTTDKSPNKNYRWTSSSRIRFWPVRVMWAHPEWNSNYWLDSNLRSWIRRARPNPFVSFLYGLFRTALLVHQHPSVYR